jgi:hypothetical protein
MSFVNQLQYSVEVTTLTYSNYHAFPAKIDHPQNRFKLSPSFENKRNLNFLFQIF